MRTEYKIDEKRFLDLSAIYTASKSKQIRKTRKRIRIIPLIIYLVLDFLYMNKDDSIF